MSRKIDDFFNAYPGLDLIQNPSKSRRSKKWFKNEGDKTNEINENKDTKSLTPVTALELYKQQVRRSLDKLTIPMPSYQRSETLGVILEAGYYQYLANNKEDINRFVLLANHNRDNKSEIIRDEGDRDGDRDVEGDGEGDNNENSKYVEDENDNDNDNDNDNENIDKLEKEANSYQKNPPFIAESQNTNIIDDNEERDEGDVNAGEDGDGDGDGVGDRNENYSDEDQLSEDNN